MEKDLKDQDIPDESKKEDAEKSKEKRTSSFNRRQILKMGWSVPVAFGLGAIFPKMADAGAEVVWGDHSDNHTDTPHADHHDNASRPASTKIYPSDKQSLLQDVAKIKKEVKILQSKLNRAREGQDLSEISALKLKESFQALSTKINAQAKQSRTGNLQKLSTDISNSIDIVNGLKQKMGAKSKSASLEQLNQLNKLLPGLESNINGL